MRYLNIVLQGTISEQYQDPWQASTAPSSKPPTRSFNRSSASSHEPRLISTLSRLKEIPTRVEAATSIHNARNNMNLTPHVKGQYQICAFCDSKLTQNCIRLHWILSIPILLIVPSPRGLFNVLPKAIINLLYSAPLSRFFRYKYHPRNPPEDLFFSSSASLPIQHLYNNLFAFSNLQIYRNGPRPELRCCQGYASSKHPFYIFIHLT